MPQPSKEKVLELKKIIKEEYDKEVSYKEAHDIGSGLLGFFSLLFKIDQRNKQNKNENKKRRKVYPLPKV